MDEEAKNKKHDAEEIVPDEEFGPADGAAQIRKAKEALKKCEAERKEYLDGWQRARADYINYKKDEAGRFEDMARFVAAGFINDVLPVLDSFDLALGQLPKEAEKGVLLIRSQFDDILKKRGFAKIEVRPGEAFTPERHESVGETASAHPEGAVAEVVQNGYMLRGKVLRPARVRISKPK